MLAWREMFKQTPDSDTKQVRRQAISCSWISCHTFASDFSPPITHSRVSYLVWTDAGWRPSICGIVVARSTAPIGPVRARSLG